MYKTRNQRKEEKKKIFRNNKNRIWEFCFRSFDMFVFSRMNWTRLIWKGKHKKHYCTKLFCFSGEQKWCILMITLGTRRCVLNSLFHYLFSQSVCFLISLLIVSLALIFFFFDFGITLIWVTHNFFFVYY